MKLAFDYVWSNAYTAAGFASECTTLAYIAGEGKGGEDVHEAAVAAGAAANNAARRIGNQAPAEDCIEAASNAANKAAKLAAMSPMCHSELSLTYARHVLLDLTDGREVDEELRQAAGAAIIASHEDIAKELLTHD